MKRLRNSPKTITITPNYPTFDIGSAYNKLYEADGEREVTLTAQEADELLSYIQYVTWLTNPPSDTEWYHKLQARKNEQY